MMMFLYLGLVALLLVALLLLLLPNQRAILQDRGVLFVVMLSFVACSAILYRVWGGSEGLQHQQAYHAIDDFFVRFAKNPTQTKEQLLSDLAILENSVAYSHAALARLGEVYNQLGMHEKAIVCYEQAKQRAPLQSEYGVQAIYSYSLLYQGKLPAALRTQAEVLLQSQPQSFVLMNLLAIDDYFKGDYAKAIQHWQTLIEHDQSLTDERRQVLLSAIQKAQGALPDVIVRVQVAIPKSLLNNIKPSDVIFVYIKAPQQKMPLAVQKRLASELPFTVELSNQQQMLPGIGLKAGDTVQVFAKLSHPGDPLTQEGILRGESQQIVVDYGINPVNIEINRGNS